MEELERIMVAQGDGTYSVFWGTEESWCETAISNRKGLCSYLQGLMAGSNISYTRIINGPEEGSQWFYAGLPLDETEFQELIKLVKPQDSF
ncbi:MAG: hypothetical protein ABIB71_09530 [Candidatus Woesearchaeota archaeon]